MCCPSSRTSESLSICIQHGGSCRSHVPQSPPHRRQIAVFVLTDLDSTPTGVPLSRCSCASRSQTCNLRSNYRCRDRRYAGTGNETQWSGEGTGAISWKEPIVGHRSHPPTDRDGQKRRLPGRERPVAGATPEYTTAAEPNRKEDRSRSGSQHPGRRTVSSIIGAEALAIVAAPHPHAIAHEPHRCARRRPCSPRHRPITLPPQHRTSSRAMAHRQAIAKTVALARTL